MGNKDFKKGMQAGAKPFEEKFKKTADQIDGLGKKINSKLDAFDETFDTIIDDLNSIERKRLYDLNTLVDILELDEAERELLVAILLTLGSIEEPTELQQLFIRSVKNYLKITNPQIEVNLLSIENIESINSQKAILQTIMEFLFLAFGNHDYLEEYEELLSYFSINRRGKKEIIAKINAIYEMTGLEGIAENYGYVPKMDKKKEEKTGNSEKEIKITENELTEIEINTILNINQGETKVFTNNIIHLKKIINCQGNLIFENCMLFYNESKTSDEITLAEGATIKLINCKIQCESLDEVYFIQGMGNNGVIIQNCDLINCSYFLKLGRDSKLIIDNCKIGHSCLNFLESNYNLNGMMSNCLIKLSIKEMMSAKLKEDSFSYSRNFFNAYDVDPTYTIKNCIIEGDVDPFESFDDEYTSNFRWNRTNVFNIENGVIENCSFINLSGSIINGAGQVKKSKFKNCSDVISSCSISQAQIITDCLFENCESVIFSKASIIACQFIGCRREINGSGPVLVEYCEFINMDSNGRCNGNLSFSRADKKTSHSVVKKCLFNGINLPKNGYLIEGSNEKGIFSIAERISRNKPLMVVYIEDCAFKNCKTEDENNRIIRMGSYENVFRLEVDFETVVTQNCKGLDNVNKENSRVENPIIKTITSVGEPIGAILETDTGSTIEPSI